jgi:hypothetical protein
MIVCYAELCRLSIEDEWLESAHDRALLTLEVLFGFSKMIENVGIIGDRAGQLGENSEYWMRRLRVV